MGNCIKTCRRGRNFDRYSNYIRNFHPSSEFSESGLSSLSSSVSQYTVNEPSVLSFADGNNVDNVYMDSDTCAVCLETYDDVDHIPIILPCGHMFCVACITVLAKKRRFRSIRCPVDRTKHEVKHKDYYVSDVKLSAYSNKRNSSLSLLRRARLLETHSTSSNEDVHVQTLSVQQRMHTIESWIQSTTLSSLDQSIASHDSHSHNIEVLNPIQQNLSLCTDIPPSEPPSDYDPSFICSV